MSFNPFSGRMPFSFGSASTRPLHDIAVDVTYEEVKSEPKKPQIDTAARTEQISRVAMSKYGDIIEKNPMSALLVTSLFLAGALWADEHPVSEFGSEKAWLSAQRNEVDNMLEISPNEKKRDAFSVMMYNALFYQGAKWANDNPAPTL